MLKALYPYDYVESVFAIDYAALYAQGYRGLLFDIDNTLVHHGDDSTKEVDDLFKTLHRIGFKTLLLTNNEERRVQRFIRNIDTPYICEADKPAPGSYQKALALLGLEKEQAVCIGDQIFTDILGANRCGIASILVQFIRRPGETRIGKKRYLEKAILACYSRSKSCKNRFGDIHPPHLQHEVDS